MRCRNFLEAAEQAKANADRSGHAWVVLSDSSGNWHAESSRTTKPGAECVVHIFRPQQQEGDGQ